MIKGTVKDHFSKSMDSLFANIKREGLPIDHEDMKSLIFGDYMDPDAEGDDRLYKEISGQFSNCYFKTARLIDSPIRNVLIEVFQFDNSF